MAAVNQLTFCLVSIVFFQLCSAIQTDREQEKTKEELLKVSKQRWSMKTVEELIICFQHQAMAMRRRNLGRNGECCKIKYHKSRLNRYPSQDNMSTFQLVTDGSLKVILSGDVQENPGPVNNPCSVCGRAVAKNHRAIECDKCQK